MTTISFRSPEAAAAAQAILRRFAAKEGHRPTPGIYVIPTGDGPALAATDGATLRVLPAAEWGADVEGARHGVAFAFDTLEPLDAGALKGIDRMLPTAARGPHAASIDRAKVIGAIKAWLRAADKDYKATLAHWKATELVEIKAAAATNTANFALFKAERKAWKAAHAAAEAERKARAKAGKDAYAAAKAAWKAGNGAKPTKPAPEPRAHVAPPPSRPRKVGRSFLPRPEPLAYPANVLIQTLPSGEVSMALADRSSDRVVIGEASSRHNLPALLAGLDGRLLVRVLEAFTGDTVNVTFDDTLDPVHVCAPGDPAQGSALIAPVRGA